MRIVLSTFVREQNTGPKMKEDSLEIDLCIIHVRCKEAVSFRMLISSKHLCVYLLV